MPHGTDKTQPIERPATPSGGGQPMTADQAALLKKLAREAYDLDAFSARLTEVEASRRIAMLQAKLQRLSEPPHTQ